MNPDWIETPHLELIGANLGNRFHQYFAALTLAERLGGITIGNTDFPDWQIWSEPRDPRRYRRLLTIDDIKQFDIAAIEALCRQDPSLYIRNRNHLQRQEFYRPPEAYRQHFPIIAKDAYTCRANEILINIRTGDIAGGFAAHYPLMPIAFYEDIVRLTELRPVFMGQIDAGPYIEALRARFPQATFIPSLGPIGDFDTIRLAHSIVPSVSTFALAAAWLSQARHIYLPLNGFLNPAHMRDIDLLPLDDPRYRFFLFPLNYALPQEQALRHHEAMRGLWREISRERAAVLQRHAPFIGRYRQGGEAVVPNFEEAAYVHRHLDAAQDISDGWYQDGLHHYLDFGRARGYGPGPAIVRNEPLSEQYPNIALRAAATQSSVSEWSAGGSASTDAAGAVDGDTIKDYGFHTAQELAPWWSVDLGETFILKEIRIYNRKGPVVLQERAVPLLVEISETGERWAELFRTLPGQMFGVGENAMMPLCWQAQQPVSARLVRISIPERVSFLHLAQVEVRGIPL